MPLSVRTLTPPATLARSNRPLSLQEIDERLKVSWKLRRVPNDRQCAESRGRPGHKQYCTALYSSPIWRPVKCCQCSEEREGRERRAGKWIPLVSDSGIPPIRRRRFRSDGRFGRCRRPSRLDVCRQDRRGRGRTGLDWDWIWHFAFRSQSHTPAPRVQARGRHRASVVIGRARAVFLPGRADDAARRGEARREDCCDRNRSSSRPSSSYRRLSPPWSPSLRWRSLPSALGCWANVVALSLVSG